MKRLNVLTLRGFTLIELLIVITIIGILIVGLVPRIVGAPAKARDATRLADSSQVSTALESYFSDNTKYYFDPAAQKAAKCTSDTAFNAALRGNYITSVPSDPSNGNLTTAFGVGCTGAYVYKPIASAETSGYGIGFVLASNVERDENGNIACTALLVALDTTTEVTASITNALATSGDCYVLVR